MAEVTIRYQSPANDPHKVPRPHYITITGHDTQVRGGEVGVLRRFTGLSRTARPTFTDRNWVTPERLVGDPTAVLDAPFTGWFACFEGSEPGDLFTYTEAIESVEVVNDVEAYTPPPVRWEVRPNDGVSSPLRLHGDMGNTGMALPVTEADLDALFAVLADRVLHAHEGGSEVHPALAFARLAARYHIGDEAWADMLIEFLAIAPADRSARLEEDGIEP